MNRTIEELEKNFEQNEKLQNFILDLYIRYQYEKEYEDIQDYLKAIQKQLPEAKKITSRPFTIKCELPDGEFKIIVKTVKGYAKLYYGTLKI